MVFGFFKKKGVIDTTAASLPKKVRPAYYASLNDYLSLRGKDVSNLQCKAYDMLWDSIHANAYINQMTNLTVNTGLSLEAAPDSTVLELAPADAQAWANKTESYFRLWQMSKEVDFTLRDNFGQLQIQDFMSRMIFGESFALLRYSTDKTRLNPISIQLIPPRMVGGPDTTQFQEAKDRGNEIVDGIEIDGRGQEVALYIEVSDVDGNVEYKRFPYKGAKSGKTLVLHGYKSTAGQYRGVPRLAKIFQELKKIADSQVFELASMAANATLLGSIERDQDVVNPTKFPGLGSVGFDRLTDEPICAQTTSSLDANNIDISKGGLILENLEPGEKLKIQDSTRPNLNVPEFIDQLLQWIGPSLGIPASVWKMQFSSNYSASKGEIELAWRNMDVEAFDFYSDFNQPIYEGWMEGAIASGNIIAPGWDQPYKRQAWVNAKWNRIPIPALNPLQEAKASTELIKEGLSTRDRESQRRTGSSFKNNAERLTIENEALAEANEAITPQEESSEGGSSIPDDSEGA
jgi:lambda family phage portal protein